MNYWIIIIPVLIAALLLIIWFVRKRNSLRGNLFGQGVDVLLKGSDPRERAPFMDDIDIIIENSKKLGEVMGTSGNGQMYERILLDKELIGRIKNSSTKKEIEEILLEWARKNYPGVGSSRDENQEDKVLLETKRKKSPSKSHKSKSSAEEKISSRKNNDQDTLKQKSQNKSSTQEPGEGKGKDEGKGAYKEENEIIKKLTEEARQLYDEVKSLLESKNYDKLIEIIKNLKANRIESLINYYHKNFGGDKFGKMLKNSQTPQDVLVLLKMETIDGLNNELERIKDLAGYARRKGKEVQHQTLELLSIPQKIKMFAVTFDKKDFYKVRSALLKIESEIDEILAEKKSDKKESSKEESKTNSSQ